jgi:hypothetical protein
MSWLTSCLVALIVCLFLGRQGGVHVKAAEMNPGLGPQVIRQAVDKVADHVDGIEKGPYVGPAEHAGNVREADIAGKVGDHRDRVGQGIDDRLDGIEDVLDRAEHFACEASEEIPEVQFDVVEGDLSGGLRPFFPFRETPVQGEIRADVRHEAPNGSSRCRGHVGPTSQVVEDLIEAHAAEGLAQGEASSLLGSLSPP